MTVDLDAAELRFPAGLPGFPEARRFTLERWGGDESPFLLLQDVDAPDVAFIAVAPASFFPEYDPELGADVRDQVDLGPDEEPLVLVLITAPGRAEDATANLLGPLVVNRRTREVTQAVLADERWSTRVPLVRSASDPSE